MWCQSEPHTGAGLKFKTFRCSPLTCKTQAKVIGGTTPCYQVFMRVMQQSNVQHARFSARWGNFTTQKLLTLNGISLEHCRPHSQQELCVPYNRPQGRFQCLLQSILSVPAQHKQTKAELGVPQNNTWVRSEDASAAPAGPAEGCAGTDFPVWEAKPTAKRFPTRAPWLSCHRVIGYFPTWSASSPGQQDRNAAETSSFQRITPGSGEVCAFWQSQDGLCKGKRNFSAPSPTLQPRKAQP